MAQAFDQFEMAQKNMSFDDGPRREIRENDEGRQAFGVISPAGWLDVKPVYGGFRTTVGLYDQTDYQNAPDGGYTDAPQDKVLLHGEYRTIEEVREAVEPFGYQISKEAGDWLDEVLEIEAGEGGTMPRSYRPTDEQSARLDAWSLSRINPDVTPLEMINTLNHKAIRTTPEALDRWAEGQGLEVHCEAKWDNVRGCTIYERDTFRVVAFRDKETLEKLPGTFVSDRFETAHVSTSFRSTLDAAFEAHEIYGRGDPKDERHIKHVIDNSKQMVREAARELASEERAITPQR